MGRENYVRVREISWERKSQVRVKEISGERERVRLGLGR